MFKSGSPFIHFLELRGGCIISQSMKYATPLCFHKANIHLRDPGINR